MSANISVHEMQEEGFVQQVGQLLARSGVAVQQLVLEITESAIMHDPENGRTVLQDLRGLGLALSLGDFGIGRSSLTYLKDLPLDRESFRVVFASRRHDRVTAPNATRFS